MSFRRKRNFCSTGGGGVEEGEKIKNVQKSLGETDVLIGLLSRAERDPALSFSKRRGQRTRTREGTIEQAS